jgi:hypothetical protein
VYSDPTLIRRHTVKVRFNDREAELVNALVNFTGEEKAAFIRALILDRAMEVMHVDQSAAFAAGTRGAQPSLFGA